LPPIPPSLAEQNALQNVQPPASGGPPPPPTFPPPLPPIPPSLAKQPAVHNVPPSAPGGPPPPLPFPPPVLPNPPSSSPAASIAQSVSASAPTIIPIPPLPAQTAPAVVDPNIGFLEEIKGLLKNTSELFNHFDFEPVIDPLDVNTLNFNYTSGANPTANIKETVSLVIESRISGIYNLFTQHTQEFIDLHELSNFDAQLTSILDNLISCSDQTVLGNIQGEMDQIRSTIGGLPERAQEEIIDREEQILDEIGERGVKSFINDSLNNLDPNNHASIRGMFTQIHSECERLLAQYNTSIATVDREIEDLYTETETTILASIQDNTQKLIACIRKTTKTSLDQTMGLLDQIQGKITDPAGAIPAGIQKGNGILEQIGRLLQ
jgi:hypothetical protein